MTKEELEILVTQLKDENKQKDQTIEAYKTKHEDNETKIKTLSENVDNLKIKNSDLFLKVIQQPIKEDNKQDTVQDTSNISISDITNKLIGE